MNFPLLQEKQETIKTPLMYSGLLAQLQLEGIELQEEIKKLQEEIKKLQEKQETNKAEQEEMKKLQEMKKSAARKAREK